MRPEILAPVGGEEQLIAAVRAGADAVYLGTTAFNARRGAVNFDADGLGNAVSYCHARGVNVHVTLNTLVTDRELADVKKEIESIAKSGADAVIVQDLAVLSLLKSCCPDIALHASTQMTLHNLDGVLQARELGFSRAVLARELELGEIRTIAGLSGIETEVFLHGALCMSVSGACYLSSVIGGRSGNRGRCAQPCRLDFRTDDGEAYALSLKDMSYIEHMQELAEAGVCSFKIEGRLKRAEYVASAVKAARDALDGIAPDMDTLRSVFSRGGFTDGHLTGKRGNMFGIREKEADESDALARARAIYRNERQSVGVSMKLTCGDRCALTVSDGVHTETVFGARAEKALSAEFNKEKALGNLSKLGGTPFYLENADICVPRGMTLPYSQINAMRREAAAMLLEKRGETCEKACFDVQTVKPAPHVTTGKELLYARFSRTDQVCAADSFEYIVLPADEILRAPEKTQRFEHKLIAELPAIVFQKDMPALKEKLNGLKRLGVTGAYVENAGVLRAAREAGFELRGGAGLNILNSVSLSEYERMGLLDAVLSFEINASSVASLGGYIKRGAIGYGYLPLMRMRACPFARNGCKDCKSVRRLKDRTGAEFMADCCNKRFTTLYNSVPLYIGDKTPDGLDFSLLYFTFEDRKRAEEVTELYKNKRPFDEGRTNGLYFRRLE